ncbi:MAG: DUF4382 domain-containing protein [Nitrososphaerota archaeon]|nr:DUF4382 domain-containing protein [Nitrososphaerota archaeon]
MKEIRNGRVRARGRFGVTKVTTTIIAIIVVAAILLAVGVAEYGMHGQGRGPAYTTLTTSTSSQSSIESNAQSSTLTSVASSATSSHESSTQTSAPQGVLSILISDPPHVSENVSALYVTYSNMSVHLAGLSEQEGWVEVSPSGSIELLGTVNVGQTVATASIPSGSYDLIRFVLTNAIVLYENGNYTATLQGGAFTIHYFGTIDVDSSHASALIVDVQPFVYNFGTRGNPSFVYKMSAVSFAAPAGAVTTQMTQIGNRFQFQAQNTWFWQYRTNNYPNVNIGNAHLSGTSFTASISESGSQDITINAIAITTLQQSVSIGSRNATGEGRGSGYGNGKSLNASTPNSLSGSAIFLINSDGTLSQFSRAHDNGTPLDLASQIWGGQGYMLQTGKSVSFSYSGTIELALRIPADRVPGQIVSGQQYLVSLMGDGVCANLVVTAS